MAIGLAGAIVAVETSHTKPATPEHATSDIDEFGAADGLRGS